MSSVAQHPIRQPPELLHVLFGGARGGCEYDSLQIVRALPRLKHRIVLLGPPGPTCVEWTRAGADVETLAGVPLRGRAVYNAMCQFVDGRAPSAVMIWHGMVQLPYLIRALNPLDVPIGVHGGNPAHTMPRWVDWKYLLIEKLHPPSGPLPNYICCSQYVADSFETSRYLRRFPRLVVPNGVELPPVKTHEPNRLDRHTPVTIGMVARLNSIKDHATLVRAFALVCKEFPSAVLELAGDGDEAPALRQLVSELALDGSVRFLGDVSDVYNRMATWDLFAYATTEREGLGNAVAEAMMFGLPCVLTDVGPMHEFGCEGATARLVSPHHPEEMAQALCELIPDVEARRQLSQRGRALALEKFHPRVFAQRYAEVLGLTAG